MLDQTKKKSGIWLVICVTTLVLGGGLLVSCGYKPPEEAGQTADGTGEEAGGESQTETGTDAGMTEEAEAEAEASEDGWTGGYDVNHAYNNMICYYDGYTYISRADGIYRRKDGAVPDAYNGTTEELVYEDFYPLKRGMELYYGWLYFCGGEKSDVKDTNGCIYRMNLEDLSVERLTDAMTNIYGVSIYEDKLYAGVFGETDLKQIGFQLDGVGHITEELDDNAPDFLYREFNDYSRIRMDAMMASDEEDGQEYWKQLADMYCPVLDVAACKKMLNGSVVVSKYKDELQHSLYLETPKGEYVYLCDALDDGVVTPEGVCYQEGGDGDIWFVDYETKTRRRIWTNEASAEVVIVNYDSEYLYFVMRDVMGEDRQNRFCRVGFEGGEAEELCLLPEFMPQAVLNNCAVVGNILYFNEKVLEYAPLSVELPEKFG